VKWFKHRRQLSNRQLAKIVVYTLENCTRREISKRAMIGMNSVWRYQNLFLYRK